MSKHARFLDLATIGVICLTLAFLGSLVWNQYIEPTWDRRDRSVSGWEQYLVEAGERVDPISPAVFVVWGDYQCPACRSFHIRFKKVLASYPEGVQVIYRHWPLDRYPRSHAAARAAECARRQSAFSPMHDLLYETEGWMSQGADSVFRNLAMRAGVEGLAEFGRCLSSRAPDAAIDIDIAAAKRLGGRGTPTIVFNGLHLGSPPSEAKLREVIDNAESDRR